MEKMRIGVMCSGNGTNFQNIVTNPVCNTNEVVLMIHNTKQCGAVTRAAKFGIPHVSCLLYTSPSPRDVEEDRMPSSA